MATQMTRKWLSALCLLIALGALALYSARLLFAESLQIKRGTYAYWLCVSSVIKNVPEVVAQSPAEFYSSAGDGPKPPESSVTYRSQASTDRIRREIETYLSRVGYQRRSPDEYSKGHSVVTITVKPEQPTIQIVTVSEVF